MKGAEIQFSPYSSKYSLQFRSISKSNLNNFIIESEFHPPYLEELLRDIAQQVEEVEREPAEAVEDGDGGQHDVRPPRPLAVGLLVVAHDAVALQVAVEEGVDEGHDGEGEEVLDDQGEDGVDVPLVLLLDHRRVRGA